MAATMQIFISHNYKDDAFCHELATSLRDAGADVWYDEHDLSSDDLLRTVPKELGRRKVFIVILSKSAFASQWVQRETEWAFQMMEDDPTRIILPVTVGSIDRSDFSPESGWFFLRHFKRIEGPGYQPLPSAEAIHRILYSLALTSERPVSETPSGTSADGLVPHSEAHPRIFVSHSTLDITFASKLVEDLNAAGAAAWIDDTDLGVGNFQQRISEALADCEWFLLILTRNALASGWVRQEVDAANRLLNYGRIKALVFVKAADVDLIELPALWGVFNVFDATADYAAALRRTLKAVGL